MNKIFNIKNIKTLECVVLVLGIGLRFMKAGTPELWRDEAFSVRTAQFSLDRLFKVVMKDTAPPLHYLILKFWIGLFGNSQLSVRMPSILSGCFSIFLFYKIVYRCFLSPKTRLLALILYVTNIQILNYDQMARVYSIVIMLVLGLLHCLLNIIQNQDYLGNYVLISLFTSIGLCSYNIFPLVGLINLFFYMWYGNKTQKIKTILAYGVAGCLYLPVFIGFTIKQLSIVTQTHLPFFPIASFIIVFTPLFAGERGPSLNSIIDTMIRSLSFILITVFLFITFILSFKKLKIKSFKVKILWYWLISILLLVYFYSFKSVITSPRYLIFFTPILILLLVDLFENNSKVIVALICFSLFVSLYDINAGYIYRGDTKGILQNIKYDNHTLVLSPDGVSHHTAQLYADYPIYIYDPQRKLPYYAGIAIFQEQDYFSGQLYNYNNIYVIAFKLYDQLQSQLYSKGFRKQQQKEFKSLDYTFDKWVRRKL